MSCCSPSAPVRMSEWTIAWYRHCAVPASTVHVIANAVPATAAVAPAPLCSNEPLSVTASVRFHVRPL